MGYDSLYRKTHDRQAAIRLLKRIDIITFILFLFLFPAGVYLVHFLFSLIFKNGINYFSVILISVLSVALIIFDFVYNILYFPIPFFPKNFFRDNFGSFKSIHIFNPITPFLTKNISLI